MAPACAPTPTPYLLRIVRCARLLGHFLYASVIVASVYPHLGQRRRLELKQRWSRRLLDILGIELDTAQADIVPGSLMVANHISWLDIHALNAARPLAFVAKDEVGRWPLVGWLAKNTDTVFVCRERRAATPAVNAQIGALLKARCDVLIFAEGTTTDGSYVLPFFSALLQPAVDGGRPLQPVALAYFTADGRRSEAPAYAGETTLGQCLAAILSCRSLTVRLKAIPALDSRQMNRRQLARAARCAIAQSLGVPLLDDHPERTAAARGGLRPACDFAAEASAPMA